MSTEPHDSPNALAIAQEVNSLCGRFRDALRRGQAGPLEAWLPAGGPARVAALGELARLEFEHRVQAGEAVSAEDYFARFPVLRSEPAFAARLQATVQGLPRKPPPDPTARALPKTAAQSPAAPARPAARQFGRYRIVKVLGQGGMGTVYQAHDTQLDRPVALKVMRFGAGDPQQVERFYREARIAASFTRPDLCPVYDFDQNGGVYYLTMPLIGGEPLSAALKRDGPLPGPAAARLAAAVARAVHEAHRAGVVHRDLKPANVMLNERRQPVVMDFGLARRVGPLDPRTTAPGALLGTPAYMPPEQIAGGSDACGPAQDVYSLGVVLYEMLTARLPFEGALNEVLTQVLSAEPTPPSRRRPDLDPRLERICLKAMARDPKARYPSMEAFADALEEYAAASDRPLQRAAPAPPVKSEGTVPPRSGRRLLWTVAALAFLAVAAIAVGVGVWFARPRSVAVVPDGNHPGKTGDKAEGTTDPFQAHSRWAGTFHWENDDYLRPVLVTIEERAGDHFKGKYTADNGDYEWRIQGTVIGDTVNWDFTEIVHEKDPKDVAGVATVQAVLFEGNRLEGYYRDKDSRAQMTLRLMK